MDLEAQNDELMVLSSIYEEYFHESVATDSKGGELIIHMDMTDSITLTTAHGCHGKPEQHEVQHLPPIYLHFNYPPDYPSAAPPLYTLTCKWITQSQLSEICKQLDRVWEENKGDVILYMWSQYIKEESLPLLKISSSLDVDGQSPTRSGMPRSRSTTEQNDEGSDLLIHGSECQDQQKKIEYQQISRESVGSDVRYQNVRSSSSSVSRKESSTCDSSGNYSISGHTNKINSSNKEVVLEGATGETSCGGAAKRTRQQLCSQRSASDCDERTIQDVGPKTNMLRLLRDYDQEMRRALFLKKSFQCNVCFCDKVGSQCMEFWPCGHVYCKDCMKGYFEVQIKEGNFKFLKCPTDKCASEANPKQVEELVSRELYERWDSLLLSNTISSLGDTQPCPRRHCQYPVTIELNLGYCPACSFVFCALCRFGDHGLNACRIKNSEARKVIQQYIDGSPDDRKKLETKFGKKYLKTLEDELLTMEYISTNVKQCPKCSRNIEKIDGCNKMVCQGCGVSFCWLCMARLDPARPYSHFNGPKSQCFNKLFEGVDVDEEEEFFDEEWDEDVLYF